MAQTYNFKEVIVTINGVPIDGFGDGDVIVIEFDDDRWSKTTGNDDTTARSRRNNSSGLITLTLLSTASANDTLNALMRLDEFGDGQFTIAVRDVRGTKQHFSGDAWVRREPTVTYGRDVGTHEWMIDCGTIDAQLGGNL